MKQLRTEPHPSGGTFTFYDLEDGRHASILDDEFPFNEDFEIHLRDESDHVIQYTEHHEPNMKAAVQHLESLIEPASQEDKSHG